MGLQLAKPIFLFRPNNNIVDAFICNLTVILTFITQYVIHLNE